MRRISLMLAVLLCVLFPAACSSGADTAPWTVEDGEAILNSGAFSDELEELDLDTAWVLYQLEGAGLERASLTGGLCRRSAGATCQELTVLIFDTADSAQSAKEALESYVDSQIQSNRDYRPDQIHLLEGAWLEQRENTLLLAVASDLEAAQKAVS